MDQEQAKRAAEDLMDDGSGKRSRVEDGTLFMKILLPEKQVGNVIGKEGAVLKKIMEESNARIRISAMDEMVPITRERIATIAGQPEALLRAQQLISAVLNAPREGDTEPPSTDRTLKLLLPNGAIGAIIGKGGTVIKEIMMQTGAHIKIAQPTEAIPQTQERALTLSGNVMAVDNAQNEVVAKLAAAPSGQQVKECDYKVLKGAGQQYPQMQMNQPYGMPWMQG